MRAERVSETPVVWVVTAGVVVVALLVCGVWAAARRAELLMLFRPSRLEMMLDTLFWFTRLEEPLISPLENCEV